MPFTLIAAVLKGAAMDDVVRDATMMGAARIQPVLTEHVGGQAVDGDARRERRAVAAGRDRVRQAVAARDDPGGREPPVAFEAAMSQDDGGLRLMFVEPSAGRETRPVRSLLDRPAPSHVTLLVGPEGGWAAGEIDLATCSEARCW